MGLTKQYLRYVPRGLFNLIGSGRGGGVYLDQNNPDLAAVAAAQDVVIWDLKKKEKLRVLSPGEKFHYEVIQNDLVHSKCSTYKKLPLKK